MSMASVQLLHPDRLARGLAAQSGRLTRPAPRLVVTCSEPAHGFGEAARGLLAGSLVLEAPGSDPDHPGLRDALLHAAYEMGVSEITLVAHSDCRHLPGTGYSHAVPAGASPFERMCARVAAVGRRHEAARESIRRALGRLSRDPDMAALRRGRGLGFTGLVYAVESGTFLTYDPDDDSFQVLTEDFEESSR